MPKQAKQSAIKMTQYAKKVPKSSILKQSDKSTTRPSKVHQISKPRNCSNGYKIVDYRMRVDIIYDSLVHNEQPIDISRSRHVKYNTVRHVLQQYYSKGCINTIKYKAI